MSHEHGSTVDRTVGNGDLHGGSGRVGLGDLDLAEGQAVTALTVYAHLYALLCGEQLDDATTSVAGAP